MRFISLCPTPFELAGHGEIYHLSVKKAVEQLNFNHFAYLVNSHSLPEGWTHFFQEKGSLFKRFWEFRTLFLQSVRENVFFIEAFRTRDFYVLMCATFFLKKKNQLWILFRYDTHQLRFRGKLHFFLLKLVRKKIGNRLVYLSDSALICESYQKKLKQKVFEMPIPHIDFVSKPFALQKKPMLAWWPGNPRKEKGLEDILFLLKSEDPKRTHFKIMISEATPISFKPNLSLQRVKSTLSRNHYLEHLHKASLIFLPYDPLIYKSGTSGIFVESIIHGKIPVVKEGSWLSYELKKFGLEKLIVDWKDPLFFSHLENIASDSTLHQKLNQMRERYASFHSIDSFSKKVKELWNRK